jgi:hypothetical protein
MENAFSELLMDGTRKGSRLPSAPGRLRRRIIDEDAKVSHGASLRNPLAAVVEHLSSTAGSRGLDG